MKKIIFQSALLICAILCASCESESRWPDNDESSIYLVQNGFTDNTVWNLDSGEYVATVGVNCGGVRPGNQTQDITVTYAIDKSIIDAYNDDITQQYSGQLEMVPESCFSVNGNTVTIARGEVSAKLNIRFNVAKMLQECDMVNKKYAVPIRLVSTSAKTLSDAEGFTEAIYAVNIDSPRFFFYCNEYGLAVNSVKVLPGSNTVERYQISGYGVPEGEYKITVAYDPDALAKEFPWETILPEDAYSVDDAELVYHNEHSRAQVALRFDSSKMDYLTSYYLPLSIVSGGPYGADPEKKTLFVQVDLKNAYEKSYTSKITVTDGSSGRSGGYSAKKSPTSYLEDVIEIQMICNNTIAGAKSSQMGSTTYNNKYMRIRVIPTADVNHYGVELIPVTDKSKKNNSPDGLELDPDAESYYDADQERFVLNYRWKHTDGNWITATEYIQAN